VVQVGVVARALHDQGLLSGHLRVRHAPGLQGVVGLSATTRRGRVTSPQRQLRPRAKLALPRHRLPARDR
jgi:hypothetical protein